MDTLQIEPRDRPVLTGLARQVAEAAADPANETKRDLWRRHNALRGSRPPVFVHPDGAWVELLPPDQLVCRTDWARHLEYRLRQRLVRYQLIPDDVPIEKTLAIEKSAIEINRGWGLVPERIASSSSRGAWHYAPVVKELSDWKKLRKPRLEYDEALTRVRFEQTRDCLGHILDVQLTGIRNFSFHMMHLYCDLRGLNEMMLDLVLEPNCVHDVMAFITEGFQGLIDQAVAQNLIGLNNNDQFHYTGGLGYTDELPAPGFDPGRVRLCDVWGAAEAQEFAGVSPEMHEEFVLSYERKLLAPFGLNGYGCCDDLTRKLPGVLQIPNLRRVSVSPWANVSRCAEQLGKRVIMSWKAQPAYLAHEVFDEGLVEQFLETELLKGRDSIMEIVLRDTHTCRMQPERFTRFTLLCRKVIDRIYPQPEGGQPT